MKEYIYKVKTDAGEQKDGRIKAENSDAATRILLDKGWYPIELKIAENERTAFSVKVSRFDLVNFYSDLANLMKAGLPVLNALETLDSQLEKENIIRINKTLTSMVREGSSLSEAMNSISGVFDYFSINLVKAGEEGGVLPEVLERIADFKEKEAEMVSQIKAAFIYPILIFTMGFLTIAFLMVFVIPKMVNMFEEMGQMLPWLTRMLIAVSQFIRTYIWVAVVLIPLLYYVIRKSISTEKGRMGIDRFKLTVPLWGKLIMEKELGNFSRTMGVLLSNGVPILKAIKIVVKIPQNEVFREEIRAFYSDISGGKSLSAAVQESEHFSKAFYNMIKIGEESGGLSSSLLKVADYYEKKLKATLKIMVSMIEPLMILIMGLFVGFIVIAMMLPIYQISGGIH